MTDIDISPEAVEQLANRLHRQWYRQDAQLVLALSAALTQSRAETAAAYDRAAEMVRSTAYTSNGDSRSLEPVSSGLAGMDMHHATIAAAISALATPDQSTALAAIEAAAEARGMWEGAEIARALGMAELETSVTPMGQRTQAFYAAHDAILAAIPQGDTTND